MGIPWVPRIGVGTVFTRVCNFSFWFFFFHIYCSSFSSYCLGCSLIRLLEDQYRSPVWHHRDRRQRIPICRPWHCFLSTHYFYSLIRIFPPTISRPNGRDIRNRLPKSSPFYGTRTVSHISTFLVPLGESEWETVPLVFSFKNSRG